MDEIEYRCVEDVINRAYVLTGRLGGRECSVRITQCAMVNGAIDHVHMAREQIARTLLRDRDMQCVFEIHIDERESRVLVTARKAAPMNWQAIHAETWIDGPLTAAAIENAKCILRERLRRDNDRQQAMYFPPTPTLAPGPDPTAATVARVRGWADDVAEGLGWTQPRSWQDVMDVIAPEASRQLQPATEVTPPRDQSPSLAGILESNTARWVREYEELTQRIADWASGLFGRGVNADAGAGYSVYYDQGAAATINGMRVALQETEDADAGQTDEERAARAASGGAE